MKVRVLSFLRHLIGPAILLFLIAVALLLLRLANAPTVFERLGAELGYDYRLSMSFDDSDGQTFVETYLPEPSSRQTIIQENTRSGAMQLDEKSAADGRLARWSGEGANIVEYRALISSNGVRYALDPDLSLMERPPASLKTYLQETDGIQVSHEEVDALWETIRPEASGKIEPVLSAIYFFINDEIENAPFKGFTDAVTALRLGQASCNGKGRLFVALARKNGIPARLVGGVILNNGSKRTSHQWVEVFVEDRWIPFDPTNSHYASLPGNYLRLYTGDEVLFRHTSNINFDYRFSINKRLLAPALYRFDDQTGQLSDINAAQLLSLTGLDERTIGIFLVFPFAALIIVFLRNIVGLRTFGTFMPMLIAAACVHTGLLTGLATFVGVVGFSFLAQIWLAQHNLMKVPRLAAIITLCTLLFLTVLLIFGERSTFEFSLLALFPVVIISFLSERIHNMVAAHEWRTALSAGIGAVLTIALCYAAFGSVMLQTLFAVMPETLLLVLAVQIGIGQWSGMRLIEYFRFRNILNMGPVLGINSRNRDYISKLNSDELLSLAADKLSTKQLLKAAGVPVPDTLASCETNHELPNFMDAIAQQTAFALKPNHGSQGDGILIITGRDGERFLGTGDKSWTLDKLERHVREILSGVHSQTGEEDSAYIEPLLIQDHRLTELGASGLSDIRIILHNQEIISCMLRLPTNKSRGKANLHQGALGVSVDIETGRAKSASMNGRPIQTHPDSDCDLIEYQVPYWSEILDIARKSSQAIPLGYIGVDICIDETRGPLVLEVNGRPGIEIQNVQGEGLFSRPPTIRPANA